MPTVCKFGNLIIKGGYGEHGRSCFLIQREDSFVMFDCGILDTDPFPYPNIEKEILKKVTHIFVSHAHKDHVGAFNYFVKEGFSGILITSELTYKIAKLNYKNTIFLDENMPKEVKLSDSFTYAYGKSGHMIGAVWFYLSIDGKKYFYSGDYQANTQVYLCDNPQNIHADIAIIDAAHTDRGYADERRKAFYETLKNLLKEKKKIVLPIQQYGRGIEMLYQVITDFPHSKLKFSADFLASIEKTLLHSQYLQADKAIFITEYLNKYTEENNSDFSIYFTADTHLEKEESRIFVSSFENTIVSTGRIKKNSFIEEAMNKGKALKASYTHHQSYADMQKLLDENSFDCIIPFHNNERIAPYL